MDSIFDKKVSVYNGVSDNRGVVTSLATFLFSKNHKDDIIYLRTLADKSKRNEIKKRLPMCTVSGVFEPTRKVENLKEHSSLICIDIDASDNEYLKDMEQVKHELSKLKEMAYIGLSVSGNGLFAIIPLAFPEYHKRQFEQLKIDFSKLGITIDSACGDVTRMRCISYDEHSYINEDAVPYEGYYVEIRPMHSRSTYNDITLDKVSHYCEKIERQHIDLTSDYDSWITICASIATLGEAGRSFFHIISQQNSSYKRDECDRKFDNFLKNVNRCSIGKFFNMCKKNGL